MRASIVLFCDTIRYLHHHHLSQIALSFILPRQNHATSSMLPRNHFLHVNQGNMKRKQSEKFVLISIMLKKHINSPNICVNHKHLSSPCVAIFCGTTTDSEYIFNYSAHSPCVPQTWRTHGDAAKMEMEWGDERWGKYIIYYILCASDLVGFILYIYIIIMMEITTKTQTLCTLHTYIVFIMLEFLFANRKSTQHLALWKWFSWFHIMYRKPKWIYIAYRPSLNEPIVAILFQYI